MHGFALAVMLLAPVDDPIELDAEIVDINVAAFELPIQVDPKVKKDVRSIRIFVSPDRGLTWTQFRNCTTADAAVRFDAPRDGYYWFAVQTELWNGTKEPEKIAQLAAAQKVYVNTKLRTISRKQ